MRSFHQYGATLAIVTGILVCGGNASRAADAQPAALPKVEPKPGFIRGRVVDEAGKPLNLKTCNPRVSFAGQVGAPEMASLELKPDEQGNFEARATDGYYRSSATVETTVAGETRLFELCPVQDNLTDQDSRKGVVQEYVWKMSGRVPSRRGKPGDFTDWYGGSINMTADVRVKPPAGARWVFTLKPRGTRYDGSAASELTREQPCFNKDGILNGSPFLHDLPAADYQITGREVLADGTSRPLPMFHKSSDRDVDSLDVVFPAGYHGHGIMPYQMYIHRPGNP